MHLLGLKEKAKTLILFLAKVRQHSLLKRADNIEPEEETDLIRQFLPDFTGTDQELRDLPEFVGLRVAALEYFNEVREQAAEEIEEAARESVARPLAEIADRTSDNPLDDPLSFLGRASIADRAEQEIDSDRIDFELEDLRPPERERPSRNIFSEFFSGLGGRSGSTDPFSGGLGEAFGNQLGIDSISQIGSLFTPAGIGGVAGGFAGNLALNALDDILFSLEDGVVGWLRRIFDQGEEQGREPVEVDLIPGLGLSLEAPITETQSDLQTDEDEEETPTGSGVVNIPGFGNVFFPTAPQGSESDLQTDEDEPFIRPSATSNVPGLDLTPEEYSRLTAGICRQ